MAIYVGGALKEQMCDGCYCMSVFWIDCQRCTKGTKQH